MSGDQHGHSLFDRMTGGAEALWSMGGAAAEGVGHVVEHAAGASARFLPNSLKTLTKVAHAAPLVNAGLAGYHRIRAHYAETEGEQHEQDIAAAMCAAEIIPVAGQLLGAARGTHDIGAVVDGTPELHQRVAHATLSEEQRARPAYRRNWFETLAPFMGFGGALVGGAAESAGRNEQRALAASGGACVNPPPVAAPTPVATAASTPTRPLATSASGSGEYAPTLNNLDGVCR